MNAEPTTEEIIYLADCITTDYAYHKGYDCYRYHGRTFRYKDGQWQTHANDEWFNVSARFTYAFFNMILKTYAPHGYMPGSRMAQAQTGYTIKSYNSRFSQPQREGATQGDYASYSPDWAGHECTCEEYLSGKCEACREILRNS